MDFVEARRLEHAVLAKARERGLDGSAFAQVASLGDWRQEQEIIALRLDTRPRPQSSEGRRLLAEMARAIVLSSTPPDEAAKAAAAYVERRLAQGRRRLSRA